MKDRSSFTLSFFAAISICLFSGLISAQLSADALSTGGEMTVERIDIGDSPIQMERRTGKGRIGGSVVTAKELTDENRVGFYLLNASDKPVRAYSLLLENGEQKSVRIGLYPGIPLAVGEYFRDSYLLSTSDSPVWTFDWVLFADGSTWGPDKYKRSKEVIAFNQGRNTAIAKAEEYAGAGEPLPVIRLLKGNTLRQWSMNIPNMSRATDADHFIKGYDTVIETFVNSNHSKADAGRAMAIVEHLKQLKIDGLSW